MKKTFADFAHQSLNADEAREYSCALRLTVDGAEWNAYTVSVANQELLFYCDQGTASYVVDNYGGRPVAELIDWEAV